MAPQRIRKTFSGFALDLQIDLKRPCKNEGNESGIHTDVCKACHIHHERPVLFHELIPEDSDESSEEENRDVVHRLPTVEEDSDHDSMPELEDELDLDSIEIPLWLIPGGVIATFRGGQVEFEREQGPPWQEVLAQMLAEQDSTSE